MATNAAATTGMVRLEVTRGARTQQELANLRRMLGGLHQLPTSEDVWDDAARLGLQMREAGVVAQATDLLIAAVALHAGPFWCTWTATST